MNFFVWKIGPRPAQAAPRLDGIPHLYRWVAVATFAVFAGSTQGCYRPETLAECQQKASETARHDCIEGNINRDTAVAAAGGAAIGAIIGAAAGGITGGARGAIYGAVGGGLAGGVAGGVITYYVEHRDANAFADISASNRKLEALAESYQERNAELNGQVSSARQDLYASRGYIEELSRQNLAERARLQSSVLSIQSQLEKYREAVKFKYGSIPPDIVEQLQERDVMIVGLTDDLRQANERNSFYEERIRQLDERDIGPPGRPLTRPTT